MPAWFETMEDRFWLQPDDVGGEEARFILKALRLRRGDAVLDAPCGAGRLSLHLARAGCVVTGIDLRETFIRRARRRFRVAGLHGTFRVLDLRRLDMEGQFDGIINWGGSFGYFSEAENARLVEAYVRALRPGGRLRRSVDARPAALQAYDAHLYDPRKSPRAVVLDRRGDALGLRGSDLRAPDGPARPAAKKRI